MDEDVIQIELEARKKSLEEYKKRCQDLRAENEQLRREKDLRDNDALQIISFLRKDSEDKDEKNEALKNTITQQREVFAKEKENDKKISQNKLKDQEEQFRNKEREMQSHMKMMQDEMEKLNEFKSLKHQYLQDLENGIQEKAHLIADHKDMSSAMERKFFEEKSKLQREAKQMLAQVKKESQEEAVDRLDRSTKKILFENRRMAEELRLQVQETDELQATKRRLEEENKRLRREVHLNEQSVKEYAKQGFRQSKEIKDLSGKVKSLEQSLSAVVQDFERESGASKNASSKHLGELQLELQGLRQLVKMKNKELNNVKKLAEIILQKRTEVEQFLLEAMEQVKKEISNTRQQQQQQQPGRSNGLPDIHGRKQISALPVAPSQRVDIGELTWEDKERVLRLLFSKINNSQPYRQMPAHPLNEMQGMAQEGSVMQQSSYEGRGLFMTDAPDLGLEDSAVSSRGPEAGAFSQEQAMMA